MDNARKTELGEDGRRWRSVDITVEEVLILRENMRSKRSKSEGTLKERLGIDVRQRFRDPTLGNLKIWVAIQTRVNLGQKLIFLHGPLFAHSEVPGCEATAHYTALSSHHKIRNDSSAFWRGSKSYVTLLCKFGRRAELVLLP